MKKQIKLNSENSIDLEKLIEGGMVILANSGGGKSYAIRRIAEQAVDNVQVIILDPEGEFSSLREKYDFILAGKDADVPAEPRSAALLATKLLEINKSAVIDLYELHPRERQQFVKLFCDSLVNCPKELYHPVLIILDEAHEYVPEGKPSEATWSVELLASKGRKRGQRLILASQRISKLSKNAAAECNNKLIGRASQDIDMKRAGDELGFSKENLKDLRQLKPGEFFAFGPAISDEVIKIKVGEVKTAHAKVSYKGGVKIPPPSNVIRQILAGIKDLPKEAEKEAKTLQELKQQLAVAKRKITESERSPVVDKEAIDRAVKTALHHQAKVFDNERNIRIKEYNALMDTLIRIRQIIPEQFSPIEVPEGYSFIPSRPEKQKPSQTIIGMAGDQIKTEPTDTNIGRCPRAIYSYLAQNTGMMLSKTQVAIATGYSQNSGGFNNSISELSSAGLVQRSGRNLSIIGNTKQEFLIEVDISLEKWLAKLGACPKKIWQFLLDHQMNDDGIHSKERIATATGYSPTSGGFNNSLSELSSLGLIERLPGGMIRINEEILNL